MGEEYSMSNLIEYEFTVKGDIGRVTAILKLIKMHIDYRNSLGYPPFQEDEAWTYNSQQDKRVCPICAAFDARHSFIGTDIPSIFPDNKWLDVEQGLLYPNTHQTYPEYKGQCRCYMTWIDPTGTLTERVYNELKAVEGMVYV